MAKIVQSCMRVAAAVLLAGGLAGAAVAQDKPLSKAVIKLGLGVDPAFSAIYHAKQTKMFEKAGLNVELIQYAQGADGIDAMIAGQVQLSSAAESTMMVRSTRGDVRALAVFSQSGTFIKFVVRKGITDLKQAKTLGIVAGSVSEYSTGKMLIKYGIDEKSIKFIKGGPPEFPALLARGDVDGYFMWEPWPSNGVKQGGTILMNSGDVGYVYNMLISTTTAWIEKNPAEAKAFLAVVAASCAELRADPAKAGAASQAEVKIPAATANELLKGVEWRVRDFTDADVKSYKEIAAFQLDRKIITKPVDVDKFLLKGFYKE